MYYISGMSKKLGRPPKAIDEQLVEIVPVRMTSRERQDCEQAAAKAGMRLTAWIREKATKAAKR